MATGTLAPLGRRDFLKVVPLGGAALLLAGRLPPAEAAEAATFSPHMSIAFDTTGAVRLTLRKVEMGQGAHQGLLTLAAVELDLDPARITLVQATSDPKFGQILTGGSYSLAGGWMALRPAVATARLMFVQAAAARWGIAAEGLRTADGAVLHPDGRRLAYAALVADAAKLPVPDAKTVPLKPADAFAGAAGAGHGSPHAAVATGAACYGIDQRLPGMLFASIERAPVVGGTVLGFDEAAAKAVPGVVAVVPLAGNAWPTLDHVRAGVAVLAENSWAAQQGRARLAVRWDDGPRGGFDSDAFKAAMAARAATPGIGCRREGDLAAVPKDARRVERTYAFPYVAHAPLEPPNALAWVRDGRAEVWTGTQRQRRLHDALVRELKLAGDKVLVHAPLLGGGFGRRLEVDYGLEAALLSAKVKRPVQVLWTRGDDLTRGLYRPASVHRLVGWVGQDGRVLGHAHRYVGESVFRQQEPQLVRADGYDFSMAIPFATYGYDVPALDFDQHPMEPQVPCAWWRGTASTTLQVAQECFMDELAALAGTDPLAFRLRHLPKGRESSWSYMEGGAVTFRADLMRGVLEAAAKAAGWGGRAGVAQGIACGLYDCPDTYTACVAEVAMGGGTPRLSRLVVATDCGLAVNPDRVQAQLVSNAVFAFASLTQAITFRRGRAQQESFADFPLPTAADLPEVEAVVLPSTRPPSGIGEPATPVVTAAILNALAKATGRRPAGLPLVG